VVQPIATARFYVSLGCRKENITMCDSSGIITEERAAAGDVNEYKQQFARDVPGGLADAIEEADVFVGLSIGGIVSQEMVQSMADNPIVFAMANPDPEIGYEDAKDARDDTVIMATGRSDYPNQVNNVLGFPFIFRGALDVRATEINEEMKVACAGRWPNSPARTFPTRSSRPTATNRFSTARTTSFPNPSIRACSSASHRRSPRPRWSPVPRAPRLTSRRTRRNSRPASGNRAR